MVVVVVVVKPGRVRHLDLPQLGGAERLWYVYPSHSSEMSLCKPKTLWSATWFTLSLFPFLGLCCLQRGAARDRMKQGTKQPGFGRVVLFSHGFWFGTGAGPGLSPGELSRQPLAVALSILYRSIWNCSLVVSGQVVAQTLSYSCGFSCRACRDVATSIASHVPS